MGQRIPVAAPSNPVEIYNYIDDMVTELAIMATRAGHLELARRLSEAITPPRLFPWPGMSKSPPDLRL